MTVDLARKRQQASTLWMSGYGAGFGDRVILAEIDLELGPRGLTALMGPTGVGKSTLLRAICGMAQQSGNFKTWGEARYLGLLPGEAGWPSFVIQDARLFVSTVYQNLISGLSDRGRLTQGEQRRKVAAHLDALGCQWMDDVFETPVLDLDLHQQRVVAILRQTLGEPVVLCVDEPTVGLSDNQAASVLKVLKCWSEKNCVLMAAHHQKQVREVADRVVLLAAGRVQEATDTAVFFASPQSSAGREFVDSGTCTSPRPDAAPEDLAEDVDLPPPLPDQARTAMSAWAGPNGFVWLEKGRLAGTPRPGVVHDLEADLQALSRVGVTRLLTLLEQPLNAPDLLADYGIEAFHVPIDDMSAPTNVQALGFCRLIDQWLQAGEVVAVHCHAGHGRTGTALAAWRIWHGATATDAVDHLRRLERRWIQSLEQAEFLERFEVFIHSMSTQASDASSVT
jgi:atypical dual specificity phosphatase